MTHRRSESLGWFFSAALAVATVFGVGVSARSQDWPQWRGPLGQGTTSAKNLPPVAGSTSLKVLWKTPIPGEGCSSPIVCDGRVYLTTAYEGTEPHAWDRCAYWAAILLAGGAALLTLTQIPRVWRSFTAQSTWMRTLSVAMLFGVALTTVVLAKPRWFWQFADPWTGTTVALAELPWVESLNLRPIIVLFCGSLALIIAWIEWGEPGPKGRGMRGEGRDETSSLAPRPSELAPLFTAACSVTLALLVWRPDWFLQASQPWLAWIVTGGLGYFALAASISLLAVSRTTRLISAGLGFALAGWLFWNTPHDEFGYPLSLQNRVAYLVPGLVLLFFYTWANPSVPALRPSFLASLLALLGVIVFGRANFLQPQSGVARAALCVDANNGKVIWNTPIYVAAAEKRHSLNSLATPTPACDAERVYAYFGSGLAALDTNGRLLWLQRDPGFAGSIRYGAGSSVVLAGDRIIIYRDSEFVGHGDHLEDDIHRQTSRRPSVLIALYKTTGKEAWSITPPFSHDSYMTPLVWTRGDRREVVVATWKTLAGFAVDDGSSRWTHAYPMQQIVPSLAVNGDCLFVTGGHVIPCPMVAVRAPTATEPGQTTWSNRLTGGNIVSPVCWDGLLFSVSHAGILTCRDAESGRIHWTKRLGSRCLASLVAGDGKVYALDQEGTLYVYAADTEGSELATCALAEPSSATPAIAANALYVRTSGHLYCIGSGQ